MRNVHICSFSGSAADLKKSDRNLKNLLLCFAKDGNVSCFDMSEYRWLRTLIYKAQKLGFITEIPRPFPWLKFQLTESGKDFIK